jgi:hypothetical protein
VAQAQDQKRPRYQANEKWNQANEKILADPGQGQALPVRHAIKERVAADPPRM